MKRSAQAVAFIDGSRGPVVRDYTAAILGCGSHVQEASGVGIDGRTPLRIV
jgi:hypothetical protein